MLISSVLFPKLTLTLHCFRSRLLYFVLFVQRIYLLTYSSIITQGLILGIEVNDVTHYPKSLYHSTKRCSSRHQRETWQ
jgi:hypothetical protein